MLHRILDFMAQVPPEEHIHFSKAQFGRCVLAHHDCGPQQPMEFLLCHAIAARDTDSASHSRDSTTNRLDWAESPAYFCAATKTTCNVAQFLIDKENVLAPHVLEHCATPDQEPHCQTSKGPMQ
jgi:hypothetical protein